MKAFEQAVEFCKHICHKYLIDRDYSIFETTIDERFSSIGTGAHEVSRNMEEFMTSITNQEAQWTGSFVIDDEWYQETKLSDTSSMVMGEIKGQEDAQDRIIYDFDFRFYNAGCTE